MPVASLLFSPITLGPITVMNRIAVAPIRMFRARSGVPQVFHQIHYASLAAGGLGMLTIEATAVSPEGRTTDRDVGLFSDECERAFKTIIDGVRKYAPDVKIGMMLNHAGRRGSTEPMTDKPLNSLEGGWGTVAPSALSREPDGLRPRELTEEEIPELIDAFGEAAARAVRCGVDAVQINCANGYLIHQFLSPLSNRRIDEYGGPLVSRMRFGLEVIERVLKETQGKLAVGIRVPAKDWLEGGIYPEEAVRFTQAAKALGVDFVEVATGGIDAREEIALTPGYQVEYAALIKAETGLPTYAGGRIHEPEYAEAIVAEGLADGIDVGRGFLLDPHWGWHAAKKLGVEMVNVPPQVALAYRE